MKGMRQRGVCAEMGQAERVEQGHSLFKPPLPTVEGMVVGRQEQVEACRRESIDIARGSVELRVTRICSTGHRGLEIHHRVVGITDIRGNRREASRIVISLVATLGRLKLAGVHHRVTGKHNVYLPG